MDESSTIAEARAKALARAMAEVHSFHSPLYILRMIFEEIVERKDEGTRFLDGQMVRVYSEEKRITTGKYGFIRVMALWYILTEIYQGNYPTRPMIVSMITHRVGHQDTALMVLRTILPRKRETWAGRDEKEQDEDERKDFGWFRLQTERLILNGKEGADDQVACIVWANEKIYDNIFAIVNCAIEVGRMARSESFVAELEGQFVEVYSLNLSPEEEQKKISQLLNYPYGSSSFTMKLCQKIRCGLKKNGFEGLEINDDQKILSEELYTALCEAERRKGTLSKLPRIQEFDITKLYRASPNEE